MGSRVVIDAQALATGCFHWKRTVAYSNVVKRVAPTICTRYKENIVVFDYFFDYLCHWNRFLLSRLVFNLFLYFFSIRGGECHWQGTASGPKSHIGRSKSDIGRAEKSHKGQNVTLQCYNCRIKTGHSNLVPCFGPGMRALAKVFYRGESRGKIPCRRPNPRAKTWHKIWMTGLNPNYDTTPIPSLQNSQNKCQKNSFTYDHRRHLIPPFPPVPPPQLWMHAPVAKERRLMTTS